MYFHAFLAYFVSIFPSTLHIREEQQEIQHELALISGHLIQTNICISNTYEPRLSSIGIISKKLLFGDLVRNSPFIRAFICKSAPVAIGSGFPLLYLFVSWRWMIDTLQASVCFLPFPYIFISATLKTSRASFTAFPPTYIKVSPSQMWALSHSVSYITMVL